MNDQEQQMELLDHSGVEWGRVRHSRYWMYQRFQYRYPGAIRELRQRLMVIPSDSYGDQRVCAYDLRVSAPAATTSMGRDSFGNRGDHRENAPFAQLSQVREIPNEIHYDGIDRARKRDRQRPVEPHPERAWMTRCDAAEVGGGVRPEVEDAEAARSFGRDHEGRVGGAERAETQHPFSIRRHVTALTSSPCRGVGRKEFS